MNSTDGYTKHDGVQHSKPIPISTQHLRRRSFSVASDSSYSPTSPPVQTPQNISPPHLPSLSPSSSPILQFLSQSPTKSATFPFRAFGPPTVLEAVSKDEVLEDLPATAHARRSSISGRFAQQASVTDAHHERGVSLLRRLSLGGAVHRPLPNDRGPSPPYPAPPPNTAATSPVIPIASTMGRKPKRSATVTEGGRPRRAPSPMGERILKGHFDGF
ncbi:hypothetical protein SCLCIDRAFT_20438 [Scleroderma citrinum Foug A]|uniref:Uncharacterized protein n=1 Tax=Scleroderma citrinum Foug A TaxID=1036808 RepID=A0A0C3AU86_9AGAM|nr:hypothetical protein SCLCIDRAFT_20438 [Scleroderma citrinum Foug A]